MEQSREQIFRQNGNTCCHINFVPLFDVAFCNGMPTAERAAYLTQKFRHHYCDVEPGKQVGAGGLGGAYMFPSYCVRSKLGGTIIFYVARLFFSIVHKNNKQTKPFLCAALTPRTLLRRFNQALKMS